MTAAEKCAAVADEVAPPVPHVAAAAVAVKAEAAVAAAVAAAAVAVAAVAVAVAAVVATDSVKKEGARQTLRTCKA